MKRSILAVLAVATALLAAGLVIGPTPEALAAESFLGDWVTSNGTIDRDPVISSGRIVWYAPGGSDGGTDTEIFTWTAAGGIVQLTKNSTADEGPDVSYSRVVWSGFDGTDNEIYTWTAGGSVVKISHDGWNDTMPSVSGSRLAWRATDGTGYDIFTWTPTGGVVPLTTDGKASSVGHGVSGDRVVWTATGGAEGGTDREVFTWTPAGKVQLTANDTSEDSPDVSGDRVVWNGYVGDDLEIWTWTPSDQVQITANTVHDGVPHVSGDRVVWYGRGGSDGGTDYEVFTWTPTGGPVQITKNAVSEIYPTVAGDRVVWTAQGGSDGGSDKEVFTWIPSAGTAQVTTNSQQEINPSVSGHQVAWMGYDGSDYEIITASSAPVITSLSPTSGPSTGGAVVTINGTGFNGATWVRFGETDAATFTVDSFTKITATSPAHAAGKVDVQVFTPVEASLPAGTANDFVYLTRYQENDSRLLFAGPWESITSENTSGGKYMRTNTTGARVTIPFNGSRLDWIASKGTTMGKAVVYVDNKTPVLVDLYSATAKHKQVVFTTGNLASGYHTVRIQRSAESAAGKYVMLDAVDIRGSLTASSRYEESFSLLTWGGTWTIAGNASFSDGALKKSNEATASMAVDFTGVQVRLVAATGTSWGKIRVTTGTSVLGEIDLYSATSQFNKVVWTSPVFPHGARQIVFEWMDDRNAASSSTRINIDAIEVIGVVN